MATSADGTLLVRHTHPHRRLPAARVEALARAVLESEDVAWAYVGIILGHGRQIHDLNRDWLQHDEPTDVLSFLIDQSDAGLEGEVYVDLDTAAENAVRFRTRFREEAARYVVHGLLHLSGHKDNTEDERAQMRVLEDRYLAAHWM